MRYCNRKWCFFCDKVFNDKWTKILDRVDIYDSEKDLKIILDTYYQCQGVNFRFGNLIHWLKPNSYNEWLSYCEQHNNFLLSPSIMSQIPHSNKQIAYWKKMRHLILYFQLYLPEQECISQIKQHFKNAKYIILNQTQIIDTIYGFDVFFIDESCEKKYNFVAVKWILNFDIWKLTKDWINFKINHMSIKNTNLWVFDYLTGKFYKFDYVTEIPKLTYKPHDVNKYKIKIYYQQRYFYRYKQVKDKAEVENIEQMWKDNQMKRYIDMNERDKKVNDYEARKLMNKWNPKWNEYFKR